MSIDLSSIKGLKISPPLRGGKGGDKRIILPLALLVILGVALALYSSRSPKVEVFPKNEFEKTLTIAADKNYAPYSFIDDEGKPAGRDVELAAELANRLGMNLKLELLGRSEMQQKFNLDNVEAMMNVDAYDIAKNPRIIATIPTTELDYVVYGQTQAPSAADLYGKSVIARHPMPGLGLGNSMQLMDNYRDMFLALKSGDCDYVVAPRQIGDVLLKEISMDAKSGYLVTHVHSSIALHREDASLCMRLSTMLGRMEQEGRLTELDRKWVKKSYAKIISPETVFGVPLWEVALILALAALLFIAIAVVYQKKIITGGRLRVQELEEAVEKLKAEENALRKEKNTIIAARIVSEERSLEKTSFIFRMSHVIRTDMNGIMGYIELIKREEISEKARTFIEKTAGSGKRLLELMEDVLEMSRMENGKILLSPEPFNLLSILAELEEIFAPKLTDKNIILIISHTLEHTMVELDTAYFQRAIYNIMQNAYKFTPEFGRVFLTFKELKSTEKTATYQIAVKDNGIGMTEDFAQRIWIPFKSGTQGTGLGMAITKSIVDAMGGCIEVNTRLRQGTEFVITVTLPLAAAETVLPAAEIRTASGEVMRPRLLLVEDMEVSREIAQMLLTGAGYEVDTATNGQEAVDKIVASTENKYSAILMDIEMPLMDGREAAKVIRALPDEKAKLPIIAMTASSEEDIDIEDLNMTDYLRKPLDTKKTFAAIKKALGQSERSLPRAL